MVAIRTYSSVDDIFVEMVDPDTGQRVSAASYTFATGDFKVILSDGTVTSLLAGDVAYVANQGLAVITKTGTAVEGKSGVIIGKDLVDATPWYAFSTPFDLSNDAAALYQLDPLAGDANLRRVGGNTDEEGVYGFREFLRTLGEVWVVDTTYYTPTDAYEFEATPATVSGFGTVTQIDTSLTTQPLKGRWATWHNDAAPAGLRGRQFQIIGQGDIDSGVHNARFQVTDCGATPANLATFVVH